MCGGREPRVHEALTIGDVGRGEVVVDEERGVLGHAEVNNVGGGFQGGHCLLVGYLLQAGGVHLEEHGHTHRCDTLTQHYVPIESAQSDGTECGVLGE